MFVLLNSLYLKMNLKLNQFAVVGSSGNGRRLGGYVRRRKVTIWSYTIGRGVNKGRKEGLQESIKSN